MKKVFIQTIDDVINFKICLRSSPIAMTDREIKEGKTEIQKLELNILRIKRGFNENKFL